MSKTFIIVHNVHHNNRHFLTLFRVCVSSRPVCVSCAVAHIVAYIAPRAQRRAPRTTEKFLLSCQFPNVLTSVSGDLFFPLTLSTFILYHITDKNASIFNIFLKSFNRFFSIVLICFIDYLLHTIFNT